jgi:gallate dioxygenase
MIQRVQRHAGSAFFVVANVLPLDTRIFGVSNLHVYAAMRGQSLDDFMKTRNAPGALYSVAATPVDWD